MKTNYKTRRGYDFKVITKRLEQVYGPIQTKKSQHEKTVNTFVLQKPKNLNIEQELNNILDGNTY